MRDIVELSLSYPPSVNKAWRAVNGRTIKSKPYRDWEKVAKKEILAQRPKALTGAYELELEVFLPDRRRRDIGNLEKPVSDILERAGVIEDDCKAERIEITKQDCVKGGMVKVRLTGTYAERRAA